MKRPLALMALIALSPALGGCVAAIPLASAALIGESTLSRSRASDDAQVAAAAPPPVATPASPTRIAPAPGKMAEVPPEQQAPGQSVRELPATDTKAQLAVATAPAPAAGMAPAVALGGVRPIGPAASDTTPDPVYDSLFATVTRIAQRLPSSREKRYSAILANTRGLRPDRTECRTGKTAVLVDLDPANGLVPLDEGIAASPRLSRILDGLRAQDVAVLWLSARKAEEAVELRQVLAGSGLDPTRVDPLYLTRFVNESKATRRADAAREFCIVAVLGDGWNDFDSYFRGPGRPSSATVFDELIGDAWFLAPPPLDPKG